MIDPFLIAAPALISFSGGRTSAYMLWRILQAHGGTLPDDVHVCFANTGKEREETLRFVHECATRWNVRVNWLEWRSQLKSVAPSERFDLVGLNSASRNGEPFAALVASKKFTPNSAMRFCTEELKVNTCAAFMQSHGYEHWGNVIGLRADEEHRAIKKVEQNLTAKMPWRSLMPLRAAGVTKAVILDFWSQQSFDLGLRAYEGNCDLCFLKGVGKLRALIRENPGVADWWIEQERACGATFTTEYSYADLKREVADQGFLFDANEGSDPGDEHDAECGTWCVGEAA